MRVDDLFRAAGLDRVEIPPADRAPALERLQDAARDFYRAGGAPTLAEWADLSPESRAAFVVAREALLAGGRTSRHASEPQDAPLALLRDHVDRVVEELAA